MNQNLRTRGMLYLKDTPDGVVLVLGGPLIDDPLGVDGADEAFEEVLGNLPIIKDAIFGLGTFGLAT